MTRSNGEFGCAAAREAIHAALDADLMDAGLKRLLEHHLEQCADCRGFASELRAIQAGLRSLPTLELPVDALDQVLIRSTESPRAPARGRRWPFAAAAALLAIALAGFWLRNGPAPVEPTEAELQEAARDARMVLRVAARALQRTEQAAFRDVLTDEVSQALRRVPVQWPARDAAERRGS